MVICLPDCETAHQKFDVLHTLAPGALFAACAEADVRLVIQFSVLGADDGADTFYHLSKKAADDYLASLPLRSFIVQPSLVYGKDSARAILAFPAQLGASRHTRLHRAGGGVLPDGRQARVAPD